MIGEFTRFQIQIEGFRTNYIYNMFSCVIGRDDTGNGRWEIREIREIIYTYIEIELIGL